MPSGCCFGAVRYSTRSSCREHTRQLLVCHGLSVMPTSKDCLSCGGDAVMLMNNSGEPGVTVLVIYAVLGESFA